MGGPDDLEMGVGRVSSAPAAEAPSAAEGLEAIDSSRASAASEEVQRLTAALSAGEIDPATAQQMLIDSVVAEQMPAGASSEVAEAIRAEVEALLAEDPTLQALLSP